MANRPAKKQKKVEIKDLRDLSFKNLTEDQLRKLTGGKIYKCPGDCDTLEITSGYTTELYVEIKKVRFSRALPSR